MKDVRSVVREAASDHLGPASEGWDKVADDIAGRVASQLALAPDDRAILERIRDNEARAMAGIGHLGEDVRQYCTAAIDLPDRLLGATQ